MAKIYYEDIQQLCHYRWAQYCSEKPRVLQNREPKPVFPFTVFNFPVLLNENWWNIKKLFRCVIVLTLFFNVFFFGRDVMASSKLKITYTPVHGVGYEYAKMAFNAFGLQPFVSVPEQVNSIFYLCYSIMTS